MKFLEQISPRFYYFFKEQQWKLPVNIIVSSLSLPLSRSLFHSYFLYSELVFCSSRISSQFLFQLSSCFFFFSQLQHSKSKTNSQYFTRIQRKFKKRKFVIWKKGFNKTIIHSFSRITNKKKHENTGKYLVPYSQIILKTCFFFSTKWNEKLVSIGKGNISEKVKN